MLIHWPFKQTVRNLTITIQFVRFPVAAIAAVCILLAAAAPSGANSNADLSDRLRQRLEARHAGVPLTVDGDELRAVSALQDFYADRVYKPVWFGDDRLLSSARGVPELLASVVSDGLRPEDYGYSELSRAVDAYRASRRPLTPAELELKLTDSVLAYASDMLRGRVRPENVHSGWESAPRDMDLARYLQDALEDGRLLAALKRLAPQHVHYDRLRALLARYRQVERAGGLAAVPAGETLKPGMRAERVAALRRRLIQTGDLSEPAHGAGPDLFDAPLESAVKRYQARHGLDPDGVVGPVTLASLNVPLARRIRTIELNMERWRWLPQDLGERFIAVNIAGFQLGVIEHGEVTMLMPVVVGKRYHATPVFSGTMTYLVFSPYWNVPQSIAVNEILPKLREDPSYLERESMQVFRGWEQPITPLNPAAIDWDRVSARNFPYRFRQLPGPDNALGRVKFMFPNKYSVYLHDTPAQALFSRASRDFSHGCIRVSEPMKLAEHLLRDKPGWDADRIAAAANRGVEQSVPLATPWPVHVLYWTAWVGSEGEVNFRDDVYGRDDQLAEALYN